MTQPSKAVGPSPLPVPVPMSNLTKNTLAKRVRLGKKEVPSDIDVIENVINNEINCTETTNELNRYQYLNDYFIGTLNIFLQSYSDGNFDFLSQMLNDDNYRFYGTELVRIQDLSNIDLSNITYDYSQTFDSFIRTLHNTLDGLERTRIQTRLLNECEETKEEYESILNNRENLIEYFTSQYTGQSIREFNVTSNITETPILRREYSIYIERHGIPIAGIFDSEKISSIITELINDGTYETN
jgi:hypothetical protein